MTFRYVATILIGLLAVSVPAGATILEGHIVGNIYFRSTAPDTTVEIGPVNTLVGPGIELTNFANFLNIDLSDTNILITATRSAATLTVFELLRFADVNGTIPAITGVTINSATNFAGLNASDTRSLPI